MKVYVSADIEGIAGIAHRDQAFEEGRGYAEMRERMTAHVAAACEGAFAAGAEEVTVKDAHGTGRNILHDRLPRRTRLIRGWAPDPLMMVQGIEEGFDAALMIGYHARAGSAANPLAHTMSMGRIALMEIDGRPVGEYELYALAAALHGTPVMLLSGDAELCRDARAFCPALTVVPVMEGLGASVTGLHPAEAEERIREGSEAALRGDLSACRLAVPERPLLRIRYREGPQAVKAGHYPGARRLDGVTVEFPAPDYLELLRAVLFLSGV